MTISYSLACGHNFISTKKAVEVQYPVYLKVEMIEMLTLRYVDVCELATHISSCLCAALG